MGKVTTLPPPIKTVVIYWLHETRKVNIDATAKPGKIAGKVIYQKVRQAFAPKLRS